MKILAIQLGHNATVSLSNGNKLLEVVSQEKFDNIKNSSSFPTDAIMYLLRKYELVPTDIKHIVSSGLTIFEHMLDDYNNQHNRYHSCFIQKIAKALEYKFPNKIFSYRLDRKIKGQIKKSPQLLRKKLEQIGFMDFELKMVEHHECHAYAPLLIYGDSCEEFLIFALDGSGDFNSATISAYENGKVKKIAETPHHNSLGYVYSQTTAFLGMKPLEHEYKVMGLAAYAKEDYFMKTYEKIFKDTVWLKDDGLTFDSKFPTRRFYNHLASEAIGERFDNVAGALQYFTEKLVIQWIRNAIKKTGIRNIMTSGGVFMNVKMNQRILDMPEVEKAFFMPSCGDESNVFGATAYFIKNELKQDLKQSLSIYLGMEYSNQDIEKFIKDNSIGDKYNVEFFPDMERKIAQLLADFNTVARFAGRTEFGARSLGNRALLANPSDMKSFYMVNDQIKVRDFWMPFAPSILDTYMERYVKNYNKDKYSPYYMIATYESTEEFQKNCRAAMHQGDKTARPQVVTKEMNEKYYKIISEFEKLTGIGVVLNTSLNLHGYPLVGTPEQAIFTFENSDLEYLAMENWLISKK